MMVRRWIFTLFLYATLGVGAHAATNPDDLVKQTSERMLAALRISPNSVNADSRRVTTLVKEIVLPHFDFEKMSQLVLGRHWRRASNLQRTHFEDEFRTLLIRIYASALAQYRHQTIRYFPSSGDPAGGDVMVRTEVVRTSGPPIPIDYSLRLENGEWKVYDVTVGGVSLVINYRSSFARLIQQGGIDGLIGKLHSRNQKNPGG